MIKVSALYIVKNEEDNIKKSINSIKNGVDEIIVVDTGSTDNTKNTCINLGCKVYDYKWENDFSKARNYAISKANFEWILFLDADEFFEEPLKDGLHNIVNFAEENKINFFKIFSENIDCCNNEKIYTSYSLKLFKNDKRIYYKRKIHENLYFDELKPNGAIIDNLKIVHTGYSSDIIHEKPLRNISILNDLEKNNELETKDYYYLARENMTLGNYVESKKYIEKFFSLQNYKECIEEMDIGYMIYMFKYTIMCKEECSLEEKIKYLNFAIKETNSPDFYFQKAVLYTNINYIEARNLFFKTIEVENKNSKLDKHSNFCSYEPFIYYYLSKIEYVIGLRDDSLRHATVACMLSKKNKNFLGILLKNLSKYSTNKAIKIIKNIYHPSTTGEYEFLVCNLVNTNMFDVFKYFCIEYNVNHNGGNTSVFMAMIIDKKYELVSDTCINIYKKTKNDYYLFILVINLLYANDENLYIKYKKYLDKKYLNILDYFLQSNNYVLDNEECVTDIIIRLLYLGCYKFLNKINYQKSSIYNIKRIFICLESIGMYKEIIEIFDKNINVNLNNIDDDIVGIYLLSLYITRKKNKSLSFLKELKDISFNLEKYRYLIPLIEGSE